MITTATMINSPVRKIITKVELYNGSTLVNTYRYDDRLISIDIERVGEESKFFGFGICQKLNVKLVDINREINITTDNSFKVYFGYEDQFFDLYPTFYVTETHRDETTNELSVTAYDALYKATEHTVSELELTIPYNIDSFANACMAILGIEVGKTENVSNLTAFVSINYEEGANFNGTENLRDALTKVAEATQTIYYMNFEDELIFKQLGADTVLTIAKDDYFTLNSGDNRRLTAITHATELGDNLTVSTGETGTTQYVRDNPFWDLREDIVTLVDNAIAAIGGLTINQFECEWRGNYLLEIGDKIEIVTKDNNTISSYVLNNTISYNGGFSEKTSWTYTDNEGETADNPATLGEALNQTFAKVDRVNKEITLQVQNFEDTTDDIKGTISSLQVASGKVNVKIDNIENNGVEKVTTSTGFTFDETGLTVTKDDSEMTTIITEDGMVVYKDDKAVLTANNEGVEATDLHATTYLIIGNNSRFEDYGNNRTGCFWIGG